MIDSRFATKYLSNNATTKDPPQRFAGAVIKILKHQVHVIFPAMNFSYLELPVHETSLQP